MIAPESAGTLEPPEITTTPAARAAASSRPMPQTKSRISKIDIVHAPRDARLRNVVAAALKRACRIDQQNRMVVFEEGTEIAIAIGHQPRGIRQIRGETRGSPAVTAGDQHFPTVRRQPPREPGAEAAITAENDDAPHNTRSASSGAGIQQASRRPNSR